MAAETTRNSIWLPNHEGYNVTAVPRGNNMAAETMKDSIWLPKTRGIQMAALPRGTQYGCRNDDVYIIWPLYHEG
jgi:hypothetical protein